MGHVKTFDEVAGYTRRRGARLVMDEMQKKRGDLAIKLRESKELLSRSRRNREDAKDSLTRAENMVRDGNHAVERLTKSIQELDHEIDQVQRYINDLFETTEEE